MKKISDYNKKKITLEELREFFNITTYQELVQKVYELIKSQKISPIKNSRLNGKKPALYNSYRIHRMSEDYSIYNEELKYKLHPMLSNEYYIKNIEAYLKDRHYVIMLNDYIKKHKECLEEAVSYNERSFEIWGREKFLLKEGGLRIIKNLGLTPDDLNVYDTTEPLAYYSHHKNVPQKIVILENKDTFYSMRRHLLDGNSTILDVEVGTLIYGSGKSIHKSFRDFTFCVEPYLNNPQNELLYFGDLDFEGIIIYENLYKDFKDNVNIKPFCVAYEKMLDKANVAQLPYMKKGQSINISNIFLSYFSLSRQEQIKNILFQSRYIPQEILQRKDF